MVVQDNHSDAPLIPIGGIERLHAIRPDRVDWIFEQTQIEAETRRREQVRVNSLIFIERMGGVLAALCIGICGIVGGIYAGLQGHDWLGRSHRYRYHRYVGRGVFETRKRQLRFVQIAM